MDGGDDGDRAFDALKTSNVMVGEVDHYAKNTRDTTCYLGGLGA